jgi:hypothetical protein
MFAQALANRRARGGVHPSAPPMTRLLFIASLVVLLLVDKQEQVGLAGLSCLIATLTVWLIGRMQGARELPVEAQA